MEKFIYDASHPNETELFLNQATQLKSTNLKINNLNLKIILSCNNK